MSLFGSIQMARNTLRANEIALQVVGQNIANANTPGYIREEVLLSPAPTQRDGALLLGLGVRVEGIVQVLDEFLEERLRGAVSEQAGAETTQQAYAQLENYLGGLNDNDLSASMVAFFNSISEVLNQPDSRTVRNLAVLQGETLTRDINQLAIRASQLRDDVNTRIANAGDEINRLVEEVRTLNVRIANMEGGNISKSDAVGLRDQRLNALEGLAAMMDIRVVEQTSGGVIVYAGGDYLVYEGTAREVEVVQTPEHGFVENNIRIVETQAPLIPASGQLRGLLDSRDTILTGFLDQLDTFSQTLAFEFNKIYCSGQGLTGYSEVTGTAQVDDPTAALNAAGLTYTPQNGSFQVLVRNKKTGATKTTDIRVDLTGMGHDATLASLTADLNAVPGLSVAIDVNGRLTIASLSSDNEFAFAADTSGALAALGINTFFIGESAATLGVNADVKNDPSKFAASRGGIGKDTGNAIDLAAFSDRPLAAQNGDSLAVLYERLSGETTQGAAIANTNAESAAVFQQSLHGQKLASSGVNLDEEVVKMMSYQRSYQASARYISILNELLQLTVNI
jgi:flagellar hook-associated protein 1 FlgK